MKEPELRFGRLKCGRNPSATVTSDNTHIASRAARCSASVNGVRVRRDSGRGATPSSHHSGASVLAETMKLFRMWPGTFDISFSMRCRDVQLPPGLPGIILLCGTVPICVRWLVRYLMRRSTCHRDSTFGCHSFSLYLVITVAQHPHALSGQQSRPSWTDAAAVSAHELPPVARTQYRPAIILVMRLAVPAGFVNMTRPRAY